MQAGVSEKSHHPLSQRLHRLLHAAFLGRKALAERSSLPGCAGRYSCDAGDAWHAPEALPPPRRLVRPLAETTLFLFPQADIAAMQAALGHAPETLSPGACAGHYRRCAEALPHPWNQSVDADIIVDLVVFGDGGWHTDRIVTPLFYMLSYEV